MLFTLDPPADSDTLVLIAQIDALAVELGTCYEAVPAKAQAQMVGLGNALASVRVNLIKESKRRNP